MSQRSRPTRDTWNAGDLWPPNTVSPIGPAGVVVPSAMPQPIVPAPTVAIDRPHDRPHRAASRPTPRSGATQLGLSPPDLTRSGARSLVTVPEEAPDFSAETRVGLPRVEPRPSPAIAERAILGRYEVLCRIARGGMGTVYLCRASGAGGFQRLFALKVLRRHLAKDPLAAEQFLHEATMAGRISDPHVVGVVDVGIHDEQPYFVMDYVEGGSFHELLQRHPRARPARLVVPIVLDLLAGLVSAHALTDDDGAPLRLVHCDVSPNNMLVGTDGTCRLSDFGVAQIRSADAPVARHPRGKPSFVSPEQASGEPVDRRSDIFSAGVVLFTALTGIRLFDGATREETIANVLSKPIPPPSAVGLRPPSCFDPVCRRALARHPDDRYGSAKEMADALRAAALEADLLAPTAEVGRWVNDTFGPELQARRATVVSGGRRARAKPAAERPREAPVATRRIEPRDVMAPPRRGPEAAAPFTVDTEHPSRTVVLRAMRLTRRKKVVLLASAVAIAVLFAALAWPDRIARLFTVNREEDRGRAPGSTPASADRPSSLQQGKRP